MKIGIVGSGIAGLTASWLLTQANHEVVLFEKLPSIGMSTHGVSIGTESGNQAVDVPPRMFNAAQWPNLVRLYDCLGIEYEPVDLSKSFSSRDGSCYLSLDSELRPQKSVSLLSKPVREIGADARRMMELVEQGISEPPEITFRDYLAREDFSDAFIKQFLYPSLSSTVCTCSYKSLDNYPAQLMLQTLSGIVGEDLASARELFRTKLGSTEVTNRLAPDESNIFFETKVVAAKPNASGVNVVCSKDDQQFDVDVDHLVVATQANHSLQFLAELREDEKRMLESFKYETIQTVVHRDKSLMPAKPDRWAHFNFLVGNDASMCSVWMNRFNPTSNLAGDLFQTIGPIADAKEEAVLARKSLQRPVVTRESPNAWNQIDALHREPNRKIWFCGSYAAAGLPLLESGFVSSLNVVEAMNIELPHSQLWNRMPTASHE